MNKKSLILAEMSPNPRGLAFVPEQKTSHCAGEAGLEKLGLWPGFNICPGCTYVDKASLCGIQKN